MAGLECCGMAAKGYFDVFDRAIGAIEEIEEMLPQIQHHSMTDRLGGGPGHYHDPAERERNVLGYAASLVRVACQIAQDVMGGME